MKSLHILLCMLLSATLLMGATSAGTFGPRLIGDAYVDAENEDDNFGDEDTLWVASEDGAPLKITVLSYGQIGGKTVDDIESATLEIYVTEVEEAGEVEVHFYDDGFFETTLYWSDEIEYDEEIDDVISIEKEGWYTFDVTELMKKAVEECQTCPFSIVLVTEDEDTSIGFASRENSDDNAAVLKYATFE